MRTLAALVVALSTACGGEWQAQPVPAEIDVVTTVWAFSPTDVWVGGSRLLHYDGTSWAVVPLPGQPGGLISLSGLAPNDLWGTDGDKVWRWNGSTWSVVPLGNQAPSAGINVVFARTPTDVWIGGGINGEAVRWNGSTWTRTITQLVEINSMWGSAANDVWAVGQFGEYARWDGVRWTSFSSDGSPEAVFGFAANEIWGMGSFRTVERWNGSSWVVQTVSEKIEEIDFTSIWGPARDDVWAVGENGEIAHYDGTDWHVAANLGPTKRINAIHGSSADDVWLVGFDVISRAPFILNRKR